MRTIQTNRGSESERVIGENPPYGADINFNLKSAGKWMIAISDSSDKTIRTMKGEGEPGLNRVWWNLAYDGSTDVHLLTSPPESPWVKNGSQGWRSLVIWAAAVGEFAGPRVVPGHYTVKLSVGDKSYSQPIDIVRDPGTLGSEADMKSQLDFLLQVRGELNDVGDMINHLERTRRQVQDLAQTFSGTPKGAEAAKAAKEFEAKVLEVEAQLLDVNLTGQVEDSFRHPMRLYGKLGNLNAELSGTGADLPPTDQQVAVNKELAEKIGQAREKMKMLAERDAASFNQWLKSNGFAAAIEP